MASMVSRAGALSSPHRSWSQKANVQYTTNCTVQRTNIQSKEPKGQQVGPQQQTAGP